MYITVFFDQKPLILCDAIEPAIEPFLHHDDAVFMDECSAPAINSMLHAMHDEKVHAGILQHAPLSELQKAVWKKFMIIQAAGGLVLNEKEEVLFIFRRGKWDLPKGKVDEGETLAEAAVREVCEETGLSSVTLGEPLITTYHTYNESGHHILKESYWYRMRVQGVQVLTPQAEEGIEEIRWVHPTEAEPLLAASFPSIRQVINQLKHQE